MDPPGRSSLWRFIDSNPLLTPYVGMIEYNYNDMGLNCGGLTHQISQGYKCGVCGDSYGAPEPREQEDGGKFGMKIIVAQYEANTVVTSQVQITAHHKGYIEFQLCGQNDADIYGDVLEACFVANPVEVASGGTRWYLPDTHNADYSQGKIGLLRSMITLYL